MNLKKIKLLFLCLVSQLSFSQEGIPVYSDYLTDNYYLLHPSMAGASNCAKIRLTARNQWFGNDDAPALQTLSFNSKIGDQGSAIGAVLFNDKNGYHSQKGAKITYAHHLMFSRSAADLNQLSFGLSAGLVQNQLDETSFDLTDFDPIIAGIIQRSTYFNIDFGASYNFLDFYVHGTVKNALFRSRDLYTDFESDNLRKYIFSTGYVFGNMQKLSFEPSVMFQLTERTKEKAMDLNLKVYKEVDFGKIWGGLSYRRSFDGTQYRDGTQINSQKLQYITPLVGVNYKKFMVAYTYSNVMGDIKFQTGGFHQITLGFDFSCRKEKYSCKCPAVN
ncbi:PorP/SprF family type IX secretion system membrane protein [Flavobacterium luminosum]|uniref:Type IX secretion system membrane protein PorP/SprF n=1 Tax=Flavobacterium luminosum TaxID=2949086 RepID=A0ABT0TKV3_9FLAO|nr:type IX secretion system membrane protein PorP/SprF [Flavobacterium sp. HXWNR70]MCL9808087.1 type IX secretion system membrane protein PorP/SprF [Flavobacterium sp. HXWNR70]